MGAPRVTPLNPEETIVLWEHYRLWGVQGGHPRCPHYAERRSLSDRKCWNASPSIVIPRPGLELASSVAQEAYAFGIIGALKLLCTIFRGVREVWRRPWFKCPPPQEMSGGGYNPRTPPDAGCRISTRVASEKCQRVLTSSLKTLNTIALWWTERGHQLGPNDARKCLQGICSTTFRP